MQLLPLTASAPLGLSVPLPVRGSFLPPLCFPVLCECAVEALLVWYLYEFPRAAVKDRSHFRQHQLANLKILPIEEIITASELLTFALPLPVWRLFLMTYDILWLSYNSWGIFLCFFSPRKWAPWEQKPTYSVTLPTLSPASWIVPDI